MNIKKALKRLFPGIYLKYSRANKLKKLDKRLEEIAHLKALPVEQYPQIVAKDYYDRIGHRLDWSNLKSYTEKMQWAKLYDTDPRKVVLSDKYLVREWVKNKIGEEYLIPLLGVWDSFDEIDFDTLPTQFVLKTNHGSSTNIIVKDKNTIDKKYLKKLFDRWMQMDFAFASSIQLHYSKIERKIIAEQFIETENKDLPDYKFICFNGKPYYVWVDLGRNVHHTRKVYDLNWELQHWNQNNYDVNLDELDKPLNFEKMVELAKQLCEGFHHVRVDLYNVNGKIYFGEMTFTNASGLEPIVPEEYDYKLGDLWQLPNC